MMAQLYAACRQNGILVVKHVQLAGPLQIAIGGFFEAHEIAFLNGINATLPFTGDWKPDDDELLCLSALAEAQMLIAGADQNAVALPVLDAANFQAENVKALFTAVGTGAQRRMLVQSFSPQQLLSTKLALLFDGTVFRRVTEPSFSLGTHLLAIIDANGDVRFKSYQMLRRVFDLGAIYRQATDGELNAFCGHASLAVADLNGFVVLADEGIRKAVHSLASTNVLGLNPVANIEAQAAAIGFPMIVVGGRIEVPPNRQGAKALLSFLLDKVYRGAIDQRLFITNSNRPL
jgi:hypothetical protein